jgi:hypothetical protein
MDLGADDGWSQVDHLHQLEMKFFYENPTHLLLEDGVRGLTAGISTCDWKNSFFFYETPTHWLSSPS